MPVMSLLLPFGYLAQIARSLSTNSVEKFSGAPAGSVAVRGAPELLHDRGLADVDSGTPPLTVTFSPG